MKLNPPFLLGYNKQADTKGQFIVGTDAPYVTAQVLNFNSIAHMNSMIDKWAGKSQFYQLPGLTILIKHIGFLTESHGKTGTDEIAQILEQMGNFFYNEKIQGHEYYYNKKFSEQRG